MTRCPVLFLVAAGVLHLVTRCLLLLLAAARRGRGGARSAVIVGAGSARRVALHGVGNDVCHKLPHISFNFRRLLFSTVGICGGAVLGAGPLRRVERLHSARFCVRLALFFDLGAFSFASGLNGGSRRTLCFATIEYRSHCLTYQSAHDLGAVKVWSIANEPDQNATHVNDVAIAHVIRDVLAHGGIYVVYAEKGQALFSPSSLRQNA